MAGLFVEAMIAGLLTGILLCDQIRLMLHDCTNIEALILAGENLCTEEHWAWENLTRLVRRPFSKLPNCQMQPRTPSSKYPPCL